MVRSEKTKQYILEQAAPLFNKYGYKGVSMSQLAKAISMTKGAIYGNFENKDEIALAVFEYNFSQISIKLAKAMRHQENACDKLIAFANHYLDHFSEISLNGGSPALNAAVDSENSNPSLKNAVVNAFGTWMDEVTKIIYWGIKNKQINPNVKPDQFSSIFVSLIEGGLMVSNLTGNSIHLSRNIDHIIYLVNTEFRL